jgi:hypothetical protein
MSSKSERVINRTIDLSPFASAKRQLEADPKTWIETHDLLAELKRNFRDPIPQAVLDHLRDRLDGTAKKRQGRGRGSASRRMRDILISVRFERTEAWLKAREAKYGLVGWEFIRTAEWWDGPPSERAARMVQRGLELNLDWQTVRNIAYDIRKKGFPRI